MALNDIKDFKQNDIAYFNGKQVTVIASHDGCVEIVDQFGRKYSVNIDALKKSCIWDYNFVDPDVVAQYDQRIEECEIAESNAKKYLKSCKQALSQLFDNFGTRFKSQLNKEQLAQVRAAENDRYAAIQEKVACSNRTRSTLISKFIYVT